MASWVLVLALLGTGSSSNDLVTLIDAKDYFKARGVEMTTAKLVELATARPADGKGEVAQLLALRTLAARAAKVRAARDYPAILGKIEGVAGGKGFAAEYARRTAAALGSTPAFAPGGSPKARDGGLVWFPKSVRLVGAVRLERGAVGDGGKAVRDLLNKVMPPRDREKLYDLAGKVGNARIERLSFAYSLDPQAKAQARFYVRLTGTANRQRLLSAIRDAVPDVKLEEPKGGPGGKVTLVHFPATASGPGLALVGDRDLLLGFFERGGPQVDHEQVVTQMLAIRAGKEKSVLDGPLAKSLKTVAARDAAFVVGGLPPEVRADLTRGPNAFRVVPDSFFLKAERGKGGLKLRLEAAMGSAKEAKLFVEDVGRMKRTGLEGLRKLPDEARRLLSAGGVEPLAKALESVNVRADGDTVRGGMDVSPEAVRVLIVLTGTPRAMRARPPEPEAVPTRPEKQ